VLLQSHLVVDDLSDTVKCHNLFGLCHSHILAFTQSALPYPSKLS
jgi:hypothetical protein